MTATGSLSPAGVIGRLNQLFSISVVQHSFESRRAITSLV